jgi:hypothetical protein
MHIIELSVACVGPRSTDEMCRDIERAGETGAKGGVTAHRM